METLPAQELYSEALTLLDEAKGIAIVLDDECYRQCGEFILGCKQLIAKIEREFKPIKQAQDDAKRKILDMEKNTLQPVKQALELTQNAALEYKREQDRKAREYHIKREQEQAAAREAERLKDAEFLEQWGDTAAADEMLRQAVMPARLTKIESTLPKVAGLSTRKTWKARILSPKGVKREYCAPDQGHINRHVQEFFAYNPRATSEQIAAMCEEVGGIEVYEDEVFAGRRA